MWEVRRKKWWAKGSWPWRERGWTSTLFLSATIQPPRPMIHSWIPLAHHFVNCTLAILGLPCSHGFSQHPESHPKSPAASKTMKPWPGRLLCPGLSTVSWPATDFQTFHYYFFTYQAFDSGFYLAPVLKMGCSSLCCLVLPSSSPLWYFSHFWKHILPMITKRTLTLISCFSNPSPGISFLVYWLSLAVLKAWEPLAGWHPVDFLYYCWLDIQTHSLHVNRQERKYYINNNSPLTYNTVEK